MCATPFLHLSLPSLSPFLHSPPLFPQTFIFAASKAATTKSRRRRCHIRVSRHSSFVKIRTRSSLLLFPFSVSDSAPLTTDSNGGKSWLSVAAAAPTLGWHFKAKKAPARYFLRRIGGRISMKGALSGTHRSGNASDAKTPSNDPNSRTRFCIFSRNSFFLSVFLSFHPPISAVSPQSHFVFGFKRRPGSH